MFYNGRGFYYSAAQSAIPHIHVENQETLFHGLQQLFILADECEMFMSHMSTINLFIYAETRLSTFLGVMLGGTHRTLL